MTEIPGVNSKTVDLWNDRSEAQFVGYRDGGWPSLYAAESRHELMAESFADVQRFGDDAADISKQVMSIFDEALDGAT